MSADPSAPLRLGYRAGALDLAIPRGAALQDTITLYQPAPGVPPSQWAQLDWPAGTQAWIEVDAPGYHARWDAAVAGPLMSWLVPAEQTAQIPDGATASVWLSYPGHEPIMWRCGRIEGGRCG